MPRFKVVFHVEDENGETILAYTGGSSELQSELLQIIVDDEKRPAKIVVDRVQDLQEVQVSQ